METPPVLLVDDGELDEVRTLLEDLAVDFLHVRGPTIPDEVEEPANLHGHARCLCPGFGSTGAGQAGFAGGGPG